MRSGTRRTGRRVILVALGAVAPVLLTGPPASATFTCFYDSNNDTVFVSFDVVNPATVTLFVDTGGEIKLRENGTTFDCQDATTANTVQVIVDGTDGNEIFQIDQGGPGGPFPHTKYWGVDMMGGDDVVRVLGTSGVDRVYVNKLVNNVGQTFDVIDTNGDGNPNIDLRSVKRVEIRSYGGNDRIGVSGYSAIGPLGGFQLFPSRLPLTLKAGGGSDQLTGGIKNDTAIGGGGNDDLSGGNGNDLLKGGSGNDDLDGDAGTDTCIGGPGADSLTQCE
jgi:Ca2+-binding RTX toxin-like protein